MQPIEISKSSWVYRMTKRYTNNIGDDICSFRTAFLLSLVKMFLLCFAAAVLIHYPVLWVSFLVSGIPFADTLQHTNDFWTQIGDQYVPYCSFLVGVLFAVIPAVVICIAIVFLVLLALVFAGFLVREYFRSKFGNRPPSVVSQMYQSWKHKYCKHVKYVE